MFIASCHLRKTNVSVCWPISLSTIILICQSSLLRGQVTASYWLHNYDTVKCRYSAVNNSKILHRWSQELGQNIYQMLNPQNTPHTSPWRESYGVSSVKICEKTDRVITAPHCIYFHQRARCGFCWFWFTAGELHHLQIGYNLTLNVPNHQSSLVI